MAQGREAARASARSRRALRPGNMELLHHVDQALRAHTLFQRDVDYVVKDGEVVIVDEFTGRLMPGRRWSDGLHQAVEAKEKVKIERENQTLATITFQNFFRKYKKLSGMTGTADTEADEFEKIYKLDVIVIPTNRPLQPHRRARRRLPHRAREVRRDRRPTSSRSSTTGRPVLVGTVSIEKSEQLVDAAQAARHQARRAQRQVPRAGSRDRRAGRPQGRGHHRHQHGRPRHRHHARRQPRVHGAPADAGRGDRRAAAKDEEKFVDDDEFVTSTTSTTLSVPRAGYERIFAHSRRQTDDEHDEVVDARRPAHPRHRAARGAPHRQPAARPRRPPGRPRLVALLPLARRRPDAHLRRRAHRRPDAAARHGRRRADRAQDGDHAPSSARRSRSRRRTSTSASTCSSTTT